MAPIYASLRSDGSNLLAQSSCFPQFGNLASRQVLWTSSIPLLRQGALGLGIASVRNHLESLGLSHIADSLLAFLYVWPLAILPLVPFLLCPFWMLTDALPFQTPMLYSLEHVSPHSLTVYHMLYQLVSLEIVTRWYNSLK